MSAILVEDFTIHASGKVVIKRFHAGRSMGELCVTGEHKSRIFAGDTLVIEAAAPDRALGQIHTPSTKLSNAIHINRDQS